MASTVVTTTESATQPEVGSWDFASVFSTHYDEALRLAWLMVGDQAQAEDATAEAFAKVYRRWRRQPVDNPRAYVRRAVTNEVNSRFRRLAKERARAQRHSADDRGQRASDEQLADSEEMVAALRRLPKRQRTAVVLRYYADLSERDAADAMGCSTGTVKSNLARGLDKLRDLLTEGSG
jgi:RNA polymerase sigma-70 factor (sigma-E family)